MVGDGIKNGKYIRKKHPTKCKNCGKTFLAYKKGKATRKYCSRKCIPTSRRKYKCEICDKSVFRTPSEIKNRIFCSKECSDKGKVGVSINTVKKIKLVCQQCKKPFYVLPCYSNRMFCGVKCRDESRKIKKWRMPFRSLWEENRILTLKRDGYRCVMCGLGDKEHRNMYNRGLNVHHITPYLFFKKDNPKQHSLKNLKTVCTPCHHKIHSSKLVPTEYDLDRYESI